MAELKHFASIKERGAFISEYTKTIEIKNRDIKELKLPKSTIGVNIFDVLVQEVEHEGKKYVLKSHAFNEEYHNIGKFIPAKQVMTDEKYNVGMLRKNVEFNNCLGICEPPCGGAYPITTEEELKAIIDPSDVNYIQNEDELSR